MAGVTMSDTSASMILEELFGIGPASAEALRAVDVASVEELAVIDPGELERRLVDLREGGGAKTNWGPHADEFVDVARKTVAQLQGEPEELSSFTVRFESTRTGAGDAVAYACIVCDEQGAGEEVGFDVDPAMWAQFILERSALPTDVVGGAAGGAGSGEHHHDRAVRVTRDGDSNGATAWSLSTEFEDQSNAEVVVIIVGDDGAPAHASMAVTDQAGALSVPLPSLAPGDYRPFTWIMGKLPDGDYHKPICGPVIRVRAQVET